MAFYRLATASGALAAILAASVSLGDTLLCLLGRVKETPQNGCYHRGDGVQ